MKIRTDFVTNSSSSSFSVIVYVTTKDGDTYPFSEEPNEYNPDGDGNIEFNASLKDMIDRTTGKLKPRFSSVKNLAQYLMDSVMDDCDSCDDEEVIEEIKNRKTWFVEDLSEDLKSVDEISKITVIREYCASGEFADLIADNDGTLCELAENVLDAIDDGEGVDEALKELRQYINTSNGCERQGEVFACGFDDVRYSWSGDDDDLIALAQRLCSGYASALCEGREVEIINLETGLFEKYAEFDLS